MCARLASVSRARTERADPSSQLSLPLPLLLPPRLVAHAFIAASPHSLSSLHRQAVVAVLASRVPAQILIAIGALGTGLAPLLFAVQDYADPYWQWQFPAMILSVFGADFIVRPAHPRAR